MLEAIRQVDSLYNFVDPFPNKPLEKTKNRKKRYFSVKDQQINKEESDMLDERRMAFKIKEQGMNAKFDYVIQCLNVILC